MAVSQYSVTLTTSGGLVVTPTATGTPHPVIPTQTAYPRVTAIVAPQNIDASATVYPGNTTGVSSTNYGVSPVAGPKVSALSVQQ